MLHALFVKGAHWGAARGGHEAADWEWIEEIDLEALEAAPDFDVAEARRAIASEGVLLFQRPVAPTALDIEEDRILREFRLKVTIPLLRDTGAPCPEVLGTGTLMTHEGRFFLVTADHIFRKNIKDANSALIPFSDVAIPDRPRHGRLQTLGKVNVFRLPTPVPVDAIVLEVVDQEIIDMLHAGWGFLTVAQVDLPVPDDRFVISGFMFDQASFNDGVVFQAMMNLETDLLHETPDVEEPAPGFDLFLHLQDEGAMIDGTRRPITTLKGLSGGPIWALRRPSADELWLPSSMLKLVAVQSSEMKRKWSRGVHWDAILAILRSPAVGFSSPP